MIASLISLFRRRIVVEKGAVQITLHIHFKDNMVTGVRSEATNESKQGPHAD